MDNPAGAPQNSSSYVNLLNRVTLAVKNTGIDEQILDKIEKAVKTELEGSGIILARAEKTRISRQVAKTVLRDLIAGLDTGN